MYAVDTRDRVVEWPDPPQSSVGAPIPVVVGDEHSVVVAYYLQNAPEDWDGTDVRVVRPTDADEPIALVIFRGCTAYYGGLPNDEAFAGHPLAERGLKPYGSFEILESSWIREMERRNSVHPWHKGGWLETHRHFVLTFHDSIFECVARSYDVQQTRASIATVIPAMATLVFGRS